MQRAIKVLSNRESVVPRYANLCTRLKEVRQMLPAGKPLTLTEKILYAHLDKASTDATVKYLKLRPDRVAMQDASAQTALLQFYLTNRRQSAVPVSIHCDHLIRAQVGESAADDLQTSQQDEQEVYKFLESAARKWQLDFWPAGSGIIHQLVLENYAAPGMMMLGTDSHTPNAGGLGTMAIGVGGAGAVDAMAGIAWELSRPQVLGVHLTGKLSGWSSPKDVILTLAGKLGVRGGTNKVIEYHGPGVDSLSCTGMATICNMGAEVGATTSLFPYTAAMARYLKATGREDVAMAAEQYRHQYLQADKDAEYEQLIEIDLSRVEPHLNGPFTPDAAIPLSKMKQMVHENHWPTKISAALIGSCTNSSYEDMSRAASIARQATVRGLVLSDTPLLVTPGSEQIRATVERDGQMSQLTDAGASVLANACGPCIGQWERPQMPDENVIVTSFNRNFKARNDGNSKTMNFLASPELVTSMALSGSLLFNPLTDLLNATDGSKFKLQPPVGEELPSHPFECGNIEFVRKSVGNNEPLTVSPTSQRLQLLKPFAAWDGRELEDLVVLVKVRGKCTTDHISAAGAWLKYKGHLDNLSNNTLIGAQNDYTGKVNAVSNVLDASDSKQYSIPDMAKHYQSQQRNWLVVADYNYGEGSAREHASLQPRHLGCRMILAKSFARIHETNLKKQGILPLTLANPEDYARVESDHLVSSLGLVDLLNGVKNDGLLTLLLKSLRTGVTRQITAKHTMSTDQLAWFRAGSALNLVRQQSLKQ